MRPVLGLVAAGVLAVLVFYGGVLLASESGEVVTLYTRDASGGTHATRVWIVDHDGTEWVRAGHPQKRWFQRVEARPEVELERGGVVGPRRAVVVRDPVAKRAVNEVFARKYGVADRIVALSGNAERRIPVRLEPREP